MTSNAEKVWVMVLRPLIFTVLTLFKTTALSATEFAACVVLNAIIFWAVELQKLLMRLHQRRELVGRPVGEVANA